MSNDKKSKRKLPTVLMTRTTHIICFGQPLLIFLFFIYYTINHKEINVIGIIIIFILFYFQFYFNYNKKKIFITNKKIYYYSRGKKVLSLPLVGGFLNIGYSQSKLGKILNYGTLKILTNQDVLFTYKYLNDGKAIYEKIIEQHVIETKKIDPNYEMIILKEDKNTKHSELDSLDSK